MFVRDLHEIIEIDAPPSVVWDVLTDAAAYGEWNPVTPAFDGQLEPGRQGTLTFRPAGRGRGLQVPVAIQRVDPQAELRWVGGMPGTGALVSGVHYFRFRPSADGQRTVLKHGETFRGWLVPAIWWLLKPVVGGAYRRLNAALKDRCEAQVAAAA